MTKNDLSISYKSKRSDYPEKWDDWEFEGHKVKLFQEQIQGWILNVLKEIKQKVGHSDFAMLSIMMAYFENIQKFRDGYDMDGKSEKYFIKGLKWVYPKFKSYKKGDDLAKLVYEQARCGMYHVGLTGNQIVLDCTASSGISVSNGKVKICPGKLVYDLQNHFESYISEIKNPNNYILRVNFEKRLRYIWGM